MHWGIAGLALVFRSNVKRNETFRIRKQKRKRRAAFLRQGLKRLKRGPFSQKAKYQNRMQFKPARFVSAPVRHRDLEQSELRIVQGKYTQE